MLHSLTHCFAAQNRAALAAMEKELAAKAEREVQAKIATIDSIRVAERKVGAAVACCGVFLRVCV